MPTTLPLACLLYVDTGGGARPRPAARLLGLIEPFVLALGSIAAAIHAGRASLGQEPDFEPRWSHLAALLALDGKEDAARAARERPSDILASREGGAWA